MFRPSCNMELTSEQLYTNQNKQGPYALLMADEDLACFYVASCRFVLTYNLVVHLGILKTQGSFVMGSRRSITSACPVVISLMFPSHHLKALYDVSLKV